MRILKLATIFALVAFAAQAQDQQAETPPANPTEQYPVGGVNNQPEEITVETHGAWEVRCTADKKNCFMYQLMLNAEGRGVAEFTMVKLPAGNEAVAGATVVAPLGTLLTRGMVMAVDENEATQYPFSWCTRPGCFARFGLTDLTIQQMQSGAAVKIALFSIADAQQAVEVEASLEGFTAAFETLTKLANEAQE